MHKYRYTLSLAVLLLIAYILPAQQSKAQQPAQKASSIIGEWSFERFEYFGYLVDVPESDKVRYDKANLGLIIRFDSTGRYASSQPGGREENNYKARYRLINNGKQYVMSGDTVTIRLVNAKQLKLYSNDDRPLAVFKRLK